MKLVYAMVFGGLFAGGMFGADVNGKWECKVKGGDGVERPLIVTLKSDGSMEMTGTVNGMNGQPDIPISEGMNHGDEVMWSSTRRIQNGPTQQQMVQFDYKGAISGDEMKITITRADGKAAPMSCTAKKVK